MRPLPAVGMPDVDRRHVVRPRGPYTRSQQFADEVVKVERFARMMRDKDPMAESVGPAAADPGRVWLGCAWSSWRCRRT